MLFNLIINHVHLSTIYYTKRLRPRVHWYNTKQLCTMHECLNNLIMCLDWQWHIIYFLFWYIIHRTIITWQVQIKTIYLRVLETCSFARRGPYFGNTYHWRWYLNPGIYFNNICSNVSFQERKWKYYDGQYSTGDLIIIIITKYDSSFLVGWKQIVVLQDDRFMKNFFFFFKFYPRFS